jgi:hypothetical protein
LESQVCRIHWKKNWNNSRVDAESITYQPNGVCVYVCTKREEKYVNMHHVYL